MVLLMYYVLLELRHPDKNKDPQANEKFMKINEAYEVRRMRIASVIICSDICDCTVRRV